MADSGGFGPPARCQLCRSTTALSAMALTRSAKLVITDSGGIQEETTFLGVQCITVRDNTERPVTISEGTNQLVGTDLKKVEVAAEKVLAGEIKQGAVPELWDGQTAERIVRIVTELTN